MKELFVYAGLFVLAIFLVVIFIKFVIKRGYVFFNSAIGIAGLFGVNLLSGITGVTIGYSVLSVCISFFLGLPGVAFLIIEKLI